ITTLPAATTGGTGTAAGAGSAAEAESLTAAASAFAEGLLLGTYRFGRYKHKPLDQGARLSAALDQVTVLVSEASEASEAGEAGLAAVRAGLSRGERLGELTNWVRDL